MFSYCYYISTTAWMALFDFLLYDLKDTNIEMNKDEAIFSAFVLQEPKSVTYLKQNLNIFPFY